MSVAITSDVVYASCGGVDLKADLYVPAGAGAAVPVVIWVHGGGWRAGSRKTAPDLSRFFAGRGLAMVSVDYRLSRQAKFPAQIEDLRTAIRWVRHVAPAHGVDPDRVGLWGASAGGHLAALAALAPPGMFEPAGSPYADRSSAVQAVVVGYAPIDFLQLDAYRPPPGTRSTDAESLELPRPDMRATDADSYESHLLGAPIATCADRVRAANPVTYASSGAPPFLILHGLADTAIAPHQSELLYAALARHGADATLCVIDGLGHGFLDRSHLDDGPPRRMVVRHAAGGDVERTSAVFPVIEDFFRTRLA